MQTMARRRLFQFFVMAMFINGCSMLDVLQKPIHEGRVSVMGLWHLYEHCVSTALVDEKVADAHRLTEAVGILTERTRSISLLPLSIERMLSPQPNRLAVDPRAMAAACSLSAAQTLQSQGDDRVAADIFRSILLTYQEPEYAYYAVYARSRLAQMARQIQPASVSYQRTADVADPHRGRPAVIQ